MEKYINIIGVINLTEETNFDLIKQSSTWLNIIFKESNREVKHFCSNIRHFTRRIKLFLFYVRL